jgi:hypothetical protein
MRVSRRRFVSGGAAAAAALAATPVRARGRIVLFVYDSRAPLSARAARGSAAPLLDVAEQDKANWRALRAPLPKGEIAGLTRWSDLVLVRGFAEEQGRRLKSERQRGGLFEWRMV